jgi:hypothetical protein
MNNRREYFTLVFKGDITKIKGNPMKTETIYGVPVASGAGNVFDALENIHEVEAACQKLIASISQYDNPDAQK